MKKNSLIYVAGHKGLVGSEILKKLKSEGYDNVIAMNHSELDLTRQNEVEHFFDTIKPEYVFLAAAKVGGIYSNSTYPAEFVYSNLQIQTNIIHSSYVNKVKKLLFLGSSCIYPRNCPQPIKEEYLLSSELEPTNNGYAVAKIAGIIMCQKYNFQYGTNYISLMPTNLYGSITDNYDPKNSHVLPGMIKKFHDAKKENKKLVELWGTGEPLREFLHVSDLADAAVFLMNNYDSSEIINVGSGEEITIENLAWTIKDIVEHKGDIFFNSTYPNGTPRKFLDSSKLRNLGWSPKIKLEDGIRKTYNDLIEFNHKLFV
jgi:GDP-L-fucose synthase